MGCQTNAALGRRQAKIFPHWSAHPGITTDIRWPGTFIEPAQNNQIGVLQAGFQQAQNHQTGMTAKVRTDSAAGHQYIEKRRVRNGLDLT